MNLDLDELGRKHGTDKSSLGKKGGKENSGHDYLRMYSKFLEPRRDSARKVLEIGVQKGNSIRMWQEYFPFATIFGLDINPNALRTSGPRIEIRLVDQSDAAALSAFAAAEGPFDVIIEDGSHIWSHQITSLQTLLPHVTPGGVYVVEDLHTSYSLDFGSQGATTGVEYVLRCAEKTIARDRMRDEGDDRSFLNLLSSRVESMSMFRRAAVLFIAEADFASS